MNSSLKAALAVWWVVLTCSSARAQTLSLLQGLLPPTLDYRPFQSPVKHQAARGTCVAFSVAAMMETFDGVPSDLSEQDAYWYMKLQELGQGKISPGGLLANYPEFLVKSGFLHESVAPYDPKAGLWNKDDHVLKQYLEEGKTGIADLVKRVGTTRYRVEPENYIFLKDQEAADVGRIKRLLADGHRAIAVGYNELYAPYWSGYHSGILTPSEGLLYSIDDKAFTYTAAKAIRPRLVEEVQSGRIKVLHSDKSKDAENHYGGHGVTLVGYTTNGFLIKNSWGRDWGMDGYAVVSFDYHRMFCDEALAVKSVVVAVSPVDQYVRPTLYLKSRLHQSAGKNYLRLSLFGPRQGGLPPFRNLIYQIFEQLPDGTRGALLETPELRVSSLVGVGYPTDVLEGRYQPPARGAKKYWVQISFGSPGELIERIVIFPNVTWANQEYQGF